MKEILDQFLQLLQQAIAAIFRFVGLVWAWSLDQINKMAQVPLENWPLWKQILLALVAAAVGYALFVAAWRLWVASIRAFAAFASFVAALIVALPPILIAGVIALAGLWVINNVSSLPLLSGPERSNSSAANDTGKQRPACAGMTARDFIDRLVGGHLQDHGHGEAERLGGPPTRTWWGLRSEPSRCPSIVLVAGRAGSTWAHLFNHLVGAGRDGFRRGRTSRRRRSRISMTRGSRVAAMMA